MLDAASAPPAQPRRIGQRARRLLAMGLAFVAVYVLLIVALDLRQVLATLARLPARVLVASLALVAAAFALRAMRWRLYLHRLGALPPHGGLAFAPAFAMGVASGKWGQVVKAHYLDRLAGVPYRASVPAVLADRVSDVAALILLLALGLALAPGGDARLALLAALVLAAGVLVIRSRRASALLVRLVGRARRLRAHQDTVARALDDLRGHVAPARLAPPALVGLSAFLLEALMLHLLATEGFGIPLSVGASVLMLGTVDLAAMLSLLPGGVLAAEGSMVALLALQGAPLVEAAALTLVFRACTLWWGVLLGALGVALLQVQGGVRGRRAARSRSI